ncbi:hypothetical protein IWQ61_009810 [Dispira simplex]|nr:hypothetical protein IWQ61_009810 [Dispira simplex]
MPRENARRNVRRITPLTRENRAPYPRGNLRSERRGRGSNRRGSSRAEPVAVAVPNLRPVPNPHPVPRPSGQLTFPSASRWNQRHMDALHVVHILRRPMEEVVPVRHCPEDLLHRIRPFWAMSREDLYTGNFERFDAAIVEAADGNNQDWNGNIARGLYTCMEAIAFIIQRPAGTSSQESNTDDEAEGRTEMSTQTLADIICSRFLVRIAQLYRREFRSWDFRAFKTSVEISEGMFSKVCPDGIIWYSLDRRRYIPYVWVEVKQLEYAPQTSDEPETTAYLSTLPQKAAEAIAMAQYHPHEVFGIEFSHRFVAFWHAVIPENYVELVKNYRELPSDMRFVMKRSRVLDLTLPRDREEFARAFLALMTYLNQQAANIA